MPIYQYRCKCGLEFEEVVSRQEAATRPCKACGAKADKAVSATGTLKFEAGRPPKDVDIGIGKDAERRWSQVQQDWNLKRDVVQKVGKVQGLFGGEEQIRRRQNLESEFSSALKEHRARRESKGIGQFDKIDPKRIYE